MALKKIDERLVRLQRMVDSWNRNGSVPRIERDIALEELRRLYDEVLDYASGATQSVDDEVDGEGDSSGEECDESVAEVVEERIEEETSLLTPAAEESFEVVVATTSHSDLGEAFDDALDIAALLGLSGEDSIEEAERAMEEHREEVESTPEPAPTPIVEESVPPVKEEVAEPIVEPAIEPATVERPASGGLFDIDDIPVRSKRGRKMISLYNDPMPAPAVEAKPSVEVEPVQAEQAPVIEQEPLQVSAPAPVPASQHVEDVPQRLGDVIAKGVTTLADAIAEEQPTAAYNRITEIRKAIGLNDKFLMIRDLFGGDANLYEDTITRLDEFDDLDECMIFIVENFRWNPDSDGAKLLVSLLERKLS